MLTIDIKDALLCLLIIVLVILAIFAIVAVYNLIKTLKQTQQVLSDFEVVSKIASERTKQLDKVISELTKKFKSGANALNSIPIIFTAISKIAKVVGQQNERKESNDK